MELAGVTAQHHASSPEVLERRTLARDHRRLAVLLRPGMRVLDVGCGSGAITAGMAEAVAPDGAVVGLDRDPALLARARTRFAGVPGLSFAEGDVLALAREREFDVVTAARALQWIDRPADALARMRAAARPGGIVVVLDYDHTRLVREPTLPPDVVRFHEAFLAWRTASGWDNALAAHLPALLARVGLRDVVTTVEDEVAVRGEPGFDDALDVWARVIDTIGATIVDAGILAATDLAAARLAYETWRRGPARRQHMVLRAVEGRV